MGPGLCKRRPWAGFQLLLQAKQIEIRLRRYPSTLSKVTYPRRHLPPGCPLLDFCSVLEVAIFGCREERLQNHSHLLWEQRRLHLVRHDISSATRWFRGQATTSFEPKSAAFIGEVEAPSSARAKAPAHNESPQSVYGLANPENFRTVATLRKPILEIVSL